MLLLPLLLGCSGPPKSIPNEPGTISAENVAEVMTVAVPDAPYLMWALLLSLSEDQYRACPEIIPTQSGVMVRGTGCQDSAGLTWTGSANLTYGTDGAQTLTFNDFAYSGVIPGAWSMKGRILISRAADYSGYRFDTSLVMTSMGASGDSPLDYWIDGVYSYTADSSDYVYADNWSGKVGVQGLGVFDIVGARTEVAAVSGCVYGGAGFGNIALQGSNRADFVFHPESVNAMPPPPASQETGFPIDTGDTGGDTGDTSETGDTGDTSETGDSADTDTSSGDSDSLCGCAEVTLSDGAGGAGSVESTCLVPSRTIAWPYVSVY